MPMAQAKPVLVEYPTGAKMIFPSLRSFHLSHGANLSALIRAMSEGRSYKNIKLSYLKEKEVLEDIPYYLGGVAGLETSLAQVTNNDNILKDMFAVVVANKNDIPTPYYDLLKNLQICINHLNLKEIKL